MVFCAGKPPSTDLGTNVVADHFAGFPVDFCAFDEYKYDDPAFGYPNTAANGTAADIEACATQCSLDALCTAANWFPDRKGKNCFLLRFTDGHAAGLAVPQFVPETDESVMLIVVRPCDAVQFAGTAPRPSATAWVNGVLAHACSEPDAFQFAPRAPILHT